MFQSQIVNEKADPQVNGEINQNEYDLIDIIGFLWRSKHLIFGGMIIGLLMSLFLWLWMHRTADALLETVLVQARAEVTVADEQALALMPIILTNHMKTEAGANAFYDGLQASGEVQINVEQNVAQQLNSRGLLKSFEVDGKSIKVTIERPYPLSAEHLRPALLSALNALITDYNDKYFTFKKTQNLISEQMLEAQNGMADLKMRSLRLFDRHANFSMALNNSIVSGIMPDLANNTSADAIVFLLSVVPDSDAEKSQIIESYRQKSLNFETLKARGLNLTKTLDGEVSAQLIPISQVADIKGYDKGSDEKASSRLNVLTVSLVGLVLGMAAGIMVSLALNFTRQHMSRIREVFSK
jgi:hypothetical protein